MVRGKIYVRAKMGFAADFCPFCRLVRQVKVMRVGPWLTKAFAESGEEEITYLEANCTACGGPFMVVSDDYKYLLEKPDNDLDLVISETRPRVNNDYRQRLKQEETITVNVARLTEKERFDLMQEPFAKCAQAASEVARSRYFDRICFAYIVAGLALAVFTAVLGQNRELKLITGYWGIDALIVFAAGITGAYGLWRKSGGRALRRAYGPLLRKTLAPLGITAEELAKFWPHLSWHPLGKHLKIEDIVKSDS